MLNLKLILYGLLVFSLSQCTWMPQPLLSDRKEFVSDPSFYQLGKASFYIERINNNTGNDIEIIFPDDIRMVIKKDHEIKHKIIVPNVDLYGKYSEGTFFIYEKNAKLNNRVLGFVHLTLLSRFGNTSTLDKENELDCFKTVFRIAKDFDKGTSLAFSEELIDLKKASRVAFKLSLDLKGANLEESTLKIKVLLDDYEYDLCTTQEECFR